MNVFILCIFALVPYHNASVHEARLTVCPDFSQILRFENEIMSYEFPAESPAPRTEVASDPLQDGLEEPEIAQKPSSKPKQQITKQKKREEPGTLEIPEILSPQPLSPSQNVVFATAEEPIETAPQVPDESKAQEATQADVPIRRPWGALTFFIFLLLLSVSGNIFLSWQLIETRKAKIK